jgi:stage III sporulation protein SpoIIIAA
MEDFNLVIEILIVDTRSEIYAKLPYLSSFNLAIEILIVDTRSEIYAKLPYLSSFNLAIEILIVDTAPLWKPTIASVQNTTFYQPRILGV